MRLAGCVAADDEAAELRAAAGDAEPPESWLTRREAGEPLAWIVGSVDFGGVRVRVDPGVYVPRAESIELARRAASSLRPGDRLLDLCTGSGAIAAWVAAAVPGVAVIGVDRDRAAVRCAAANGVAVVRAEVGALPVRGPFAAVTAVAPYVPTGAIGLLPADVVRHEPRAALDGGADGLDVARLVVAAAARLLRPGGWLGLEVGGDQDRALAPALAAAGLVDVEPWTDEDGDLRGLGARHP